MVDQLSMNLSLSLVGPTRPEAVHSSAKFSGNEEMKNVIPWALSRWSFLSHFLISFALLT